MTTTFVPCAIVGSQDNEICCVSHRSIFQVVLLHLQPVTLAWFIYALRVGRREQANRHNTCTWLTRARLKDYVSYGSKFS